MQIEFHYYITYILARAAGFGKEDASIIAYSSQFTDDNRWKYNVKINKSQSYQNYISQTLDVFKPKEEFLRVYPCFHYVPGAFESACAKRADGKQHPLNTTANSKNGNIILQEGFRSKNLYRIGIAVHAYADSWAHQNFAGCKDDFNRLYGLFEGIIPDIGHADALDKPDIPFLIWTDNRLLESSRLIQNKQRLLDAACHIFFKLFKYVDKKTNSGRIKQSWEKLSKQIDSGIGQESRSRDFHQHNRIRKYQLIDDIPLYDRKAWFKEAIRTDFKPQFENSPNMRVTQSVRFIAKDNFYESNWFKYQQAVKDHQAFAIHLFTPRFKQIGFSDLEKF